MNKTLLGYVPDRSPIYAIHPFVKLFFLLVVSLFPLFIAAPEWNFGLIIFVLLLMWYSRINMGIMRIYVPVAISMASIIFLAYVILGGYHPEYAQIGRLLAIRVLGTHPRRDRGLLPHPAHDRHDGFLPQHLARARCDRRHAHAAHPVRDHLRLRHGPPFGGDGDRGLRHRQAGGTGARLRYSRQIAALPAAQVRDVHDPALRALAAPRRGVQQRAHR